jgi:2,4-dienoyl-CoA reductase-like NADH-dependent reductase (Old Yellow Enzyme family)
MLQFFSASTSNIDTKRAIAECLENALSGEKTLNCDLLIIYTAMGHNFKDLLSEAHKLSPGAQIVGCTCAGVIGKEGPHESLRALGIMAIKGPKNEFAVTGMDSVNSFEPFECGFQMAKDLKSKLPGCSIILVHPSTNLYNANKAIEGIESVFGKDIPIIGGASVDNMKLISNFQFLDENVFEAGAVMIGLADPTLELICQATHGQTAIGDPFIVTKVEDKKIIELNGKSPWKAWTERLGMPVTSKASDILVFSPLAQKLSEEYLDEYGSRDLIIGAANYPDGSLSTSHEIREGDNLWLTKRNENLIYESVDRQMVQILDRCQGRMPVAVFHADCAARGKLMFNRIIKEEITGNMQFPLCKGEPIPWLGMYGGGEYTPLKEKNMLHFFTTSLYVLVRRLPESKKEEPKLNLEAVKKSNLFERTSIKNISLKNRLIWSATWQGKANFNGSCSPVLISSMLPVARGETGLMISEMTYVSHNGICAPGQMGVYDDSLLPGLKLMTEFVHRAGSSIVLQLVHGGLFSAPILTGSTPLGPSVLETPDGKIGKKMSKEEIAETVIAFRDAALRAKEAGFDGVQIHIAHGWLLSQYLSPFFNKRTDEYGGSLENRARIAMEVTKAIRETVGENFAVLVKINSDDFLPGGFNTDEMLKVSVMLEKASIDAIEVSGGTIGALLTGNVDGSFSPASKKDVYYRDASKKLKEKVKIPVMIVGGIRTFETADELVKSGVADYISISRPIIREPGLIKRWKSGDLGKSECVSDSACFQPGMDGRGVHCVHVKSS